MTINEILESPSTETPAEKEGLKKRGFFGTLGHAVQKYIGLPIATAVAAAAMALSPAPASAVPIVDIYENDNLPVYVGTIAKWDITVVNNSHVEPVGNPYYNNLSEVKLYDLFSLAQPTFGSLPDDWDGYSTPGSEANRWNIQILTSDDAAYIAPGDNKDFQIETYRDAELTEIVVGTLYGQGGLEVWGWQPALPGDDWQGPVGLYQEITDPAVVPEPGTVALWTLGTLSYLLKGKRREDAIDVEFRHVGSEE
jgi:hypothetical protein